MIGNSIPTSVCRRLRDSQLAALRPTHLSIQLEVRFLNLLLSCTAGKMSNRTSNLTPASDLLRGTESPESLKECRNC